MFEETHFLYDNNFEEREKLFRKLNLMLDEEERAKAKFMKQFILALILAAKK